MMYRTKKSYNATHAQILDLLGVVMFNGDLIDMSDGVAVYQMELYENTTARALKMTNTIRSQNGATERWHAEEIAIIRRLEGFPSSPVLSVSFNDEVVRVVVYNVFTEI